MTPERWGEVCALFDELAGEPPDRQAARLVELARTDPGLSQEVERLLRADGRAEALLATRFAGEAADPQGLSGRIISHFRVLERLDSGGMGVIYLALDLALNRRVALKVPLLSPALDPSGRDRILREAQAAAALDHPNICSIHEIVDDGSQLCIAMPLYAGETLSERLEREGALPVTAAIDITRQMARGLAAAHAAGIVHRDIKPGNVMLLEDGTVRILDFGLARVHEPDPVASGTVRGTLAYIAPEQLHGASADSRSDLWSLGIVLHEMLTGRRPFRGEGFASLAYAIAHSDPPLPSASRDGLPPELDRLVLALLSKSPADRPRADTIEALLDGPGQGRRVRPAIKVAVALVAAGAAGLGLHARGGASDAAVDPDLVAIAPFQAADTSLLLWREGLMDILSQDLDGAGPLRTAPPSVAVHRWTGRVDRTSVEAFGKRLGAGIVIFGSLTRRRADSIAIRAAVLDRHRGVVEPQFEVVGPESHAGELADSLGVRILRLLGEERPIAASRRVSIGARSLPALKAFLRGEQFWRRGEIDSALVHYDRAVTGDSTFALALRRMSWALESGSPTASRYPPAGSYQRRSVRFNTGLAPRDSVLLLIDSLVVVGRDAASPEDLLANLHRAVRSMDALARRYPEDPAMWYELGERLWHSAYPLGGAPEPVLAALDRAIALDSGFAPAYQHTIGVALQLGEPERARQYARTYARLGLPAGSGPGFGLMTWVFDSGGVGTSAVQAIMEQADAVSLYWAAVRHLGWAADSSESAIWLSRALLRSANRPVEWDTLLLRLQLSGTLANRGHLREAAEVSAAALADPMATPLSHASDLYVDLALLGVIYDSTSHRTFGKSLQRETDWEDGGSTRMPPQWLRGLAWWSQRGDSVSILKLTRRAGEENTRRPSRPLRVLRARYLGLAAEAYLALLRGDSTDAVRRFRAIPDSLCMVADCFPEQLALARLDVAQGRDRAAATLLDGWERQGNWRPLHTLVSLERGLIAERLGDHAGAARRYRYVLDAWRRADPELQQYLNQARAGLERVTR